MFRIPYGFLCMGLSCLFFWTACSSEAPQQPLGAEASSSYAPSEAPFGLNALPPILDSSVLQAEAQLPHYRYRSGAFIFNVQNFVLGKATPGVKEEVLRYEKRGQYLQLVINDQDHEFSNEAIFQNPLPDGEYLIFAFLSRSNHRSVKKPEAQMAHRLRIQNGAATKSEPFLEPAIAYGMPQGLYSGAAAKNIVLDFQVFNTQLAPDGHKVRLRVNKQFEFLLEKWQSYVLSDLPEGEHLIELELLNAEGTLLYGPVFKKFVIASSTADS